MAPNRKKIKILINKKENHFIEIEAERLIIACEKRENILTAYSLQRRDMKDFCLRMKYWNRKLIKIIELNVSIKEEILPPRMKKLLIEINEKIINQLNSCLSPHLLIPIHIIKNKHFKKCFECQQEIGIQNYLSSRPKNFWLRPFTPNYIKRKMEYTIRKLIENRTGFPSLKLLSIFATYQEIVGFTGEYTFSDDISPDVLQAFDEAN